MSVQSTCGLSKVARKVWSVKTAGTSLAMLKPSFASKAATMGGKGANARKASCLPPLPVHSSVCVRNLVWRFCLLVWHWFKTFNFFYSPIYKFPLVLMKLVICHLSGQRWLNVSQILCVELTKVVCVYFQCPPGSYGSECKQVQECMIFLFFWFNYVDKFKQFNY